jgi:predicted dehydrogenase
MSITRRDFLGVSAAVAAMPTMRAVAGMKKTIKVGAVGCGWRGSGAIQDIFDAGKLLGVDIRFTAFADFFKDRAAKQCKKWGIDEKNAFGGANGYKEVLKSGCDIVILATPPIFRARHVEACVAAGKHMFVEKPIAPDMKGVRDFIAACEKAEAAGLSVVAGTCVRYRRNVMNMRRPIREGAIGRIVAARVNRCQDGLPTYMHLREPGMTNAAYLCNSWYAFIEMSGELLVDQTLHEQDLVNWFIGRAPESAFGQCGRWRRPLGNGCDEIFVDFDYGDALHCSTSARHVSGCYDINEAVLIGTEGTAVFRKGITRYDGKSVTLDDTYDGFRPTQLTDRNVVAEHVDLLQGYLDGCPVMKWRHVAESTATCIMGTFAAYTGQRLTMKDILDPNPSALMKRLEAPFTAEDFELTEDIPLPVDGRSRFIPGCV